MELKINGLALSLGEGEEILPARVAFLLGIPREVVSDLQVIRRSIDARRSRPPRFVYLVRVRLPDGSAFSLREDAVGITVAEEADELLRVEGVALGSFEDRAGELGWHGRPQEPRDETGGLGRGQRRQADLVAGEQGVTLEKLRAGRPDEQERHALGA
ncbi:MAG: hypothetical protein IH628_02020, partial [Proteobacteria bacterium]|nr:hypothetical protein [Pseudomonadota bacterium]